MSVYSTEKLTFAEAKEQGFIIDHHCNPPIAYKGPRFSPEVIHYLITPDQERIAELEADLETERAITAILTDENNELRSRVSGAYSERARVLAALVRAWLADHVQVWMGEDELEPDWPVLYALLAQGQVSWHLKPEDLDLFPPLPKEERDFRTGEPISYDGHTTEEKYRRLDMWRPRLNR